MRKSWVAVGVLLVTLAFGAAAQAAGSAKAQTTTPPAPAAFSLEGKVLRVARGRIELQVTRVEKATGLKVGQKIWVRETARTKVMEGGKTVAASTLKTGARVEVYGNLMKTKTGPAYNAATITIVAAR
jgi:hypothetical protein